MKEEKGLTKKKVLKIATYNLQFSLKKDLLASNILKLAKSDVSVICLQEVLKLPKQEFIGDLFLKNLDKSWKILTYLGKEQSTLGHGTCILWNSKLLKLENVNKIILPKLNKLALHEKLFTQLFGFNGVPMQRRAISCTFKFDANLFRITNIHLDNAGGVKQRKLQIKYLLDLLHKKGTVHREIICGDFNTLDLLNTGNEKFRLQKLFGKKFNEASIDISWTGDMYYTDFENSLPFIRLFMNISYLHIRRKLDYIWVKNIQILKCQKMDYIGSDHFPIVASLIL